MKRQPPRTKIGNPSAADKLKRQINKFKTERTGRIRSQQPGAKSLKNNIAATKDDVLMVGKLLQMDKDAKRHQQKVNRQLGIKDNTPKEKQSDLVSDEDMIISASKLLKASNRKVKYVTGPLQKTANNPLQKDIDTLKLYEQQTTEREKARPKGLQSLRTL